MSVIMLLLLLMLIPLLMLTLGREAHVILMKITAIKEGVQGQGHLKELC
jgi:hypothetical protein